MKQIHDQLCPLCNKPASYYGVGANNLKYFSCQVCTYYVISWGAENRVIAVPYEQRQGFTRLARLAPDGQVLLIVIPPPSQNPDVPSESISASWVLKSEYPL